MTFRRGPRPDPQDDAANLSEDDVERRLGGGAGLGGPVPERVAPPPPPLEPPSAPGGGGSRGRRGGVLWRDVGLVVALLAVLAVGARVVLPENSSAQATPGQSNVAVASPTVAPTPPRTAAATPSATPQPLPTEVVPSGTPEATETPGASPTPTPTGAPHVTPPPTPRPTATPKPATATVTVAFLMKNISGGNDDAGSFTVHVTGAGASPSTFTGNKTIEVNAGQAYSISSTPSTPGGYTEERTPGCSGVLSANGTALCTLTETDVAPKVRVYVLGLATGMTATVHVSSNANASPSDTFQGTAGGIGIRVYANVAYTITADDMSGYTQQPPFGACQGPLNEGASTQCTLYFQASTTAPSTGFVLPTAPLLPITALLPVLGAVPGRLRRVVGLARD